MTVPSSNMSEESVTTYDENGYLNCKDCPRKFITKFGLKNHISKEHIKGTAIKVEILEQPPTIKDEIPFQENATFKEECFLCSLSFESKIDLQMHTNNEHRKSLLHQCSQHTLENSFNEGQDCKHSSSKKPNLQKHINSKPKKLTLCQFQERHKSFGAKSSLKIPRVRALKKLGSYLCQDCKKYFVHKSSLQTHIIVVHKKLTYQCKECKKSFGQKPNLKTHITTVHQKLKLHQCLECSSSFGAKHSLETHIITTHLKLTPHQCQECKKSFGQKSHLQSHINAVHKKLKKHQCLKCKKSYKKKYALERHIVTTHLKLTPLRYQ